MSMIKQLLLKDTTAQSPLEEWLNATSHAFGAFMGIVGLVILTVAAIEQHSALKVVGCVVFASTVIIMYSASTLYHAFRRPQLKHLFRIIDHSSIYLLIAGTYTPVVLVMLTPAWGWTLFGIIWGFALIGLTFKLFATGRFEILSTIAYVAMGWLALIAVKPIYDALSFDGFAWLMAGGVCYTAGVGFYVFERLRLSHFLWHLCVLAGTSCHFILIYVYVVPH